MVVFMLKGKPQGKARPRVTRRVTYTPRKTVAYENAIRAAYPGGYFTGAVLLKVMAFFAPPKSASKKKQAALNCKVGTALNGARTGRSSSTNTHSDIAHIAERR